ncbi:MAG: hypothetical protein WCJ51_04135 [Candidatus Moraniibacteriota bacterium]
MNIEFGLAGFIPNELEIKDQQHFSDFPLNILFGSQAVIDGVHTIGTALYEPDFSSYVEDEKTKSMTYFNIYDVAMQWCVLLEYNKKEKSYTGKKYMNKELISEAIGSEWNNFFTRLTMVGLSKSEKCKFEKAED